MKSIIILAILGLSLASCSKQEPVVATQNEIIMLRIESVNSDGNLTISPVVRVTLEK
jgi:hypothetical protein